jgi:hypothetical protein
VALRFAGDHGPALVLGRHGLGRTAALVFDPADVAGWDGFGAAMARLVRSLAPVVPGSPVQAARVRPTAAGTAVRIDVRGDGILPPPRVEALDPRGDSPASVPVLRLAPRSFEVVLPPGLPGFRALAVHAGPPGEPGFPLAIFDPGPAPRPPADPEAPRRLADAAGVPCVPLHAIPPPEPARPGPGRRRPLEWPFLVAAALLLAVDTGLRRAGRAS